MKGEMVLSHRACSTFENLTTSSNVESYLMVGLITQLKNKVVYS